MRHESRSLYRILDEKDLAKNVELGKTCESEYLEFKREINTRKPDAHIEVALDICQFANMYGGVILVGVEEKYLDEKDKKVASSFLGTDYEEVTKFIYDKALFYIYPSHLDVNVYAIELGNGITIAAINVKPLPFGLACAYDRTPPFKARYPYRTTYGKKYYSPVEVEKLISISQRHIPIKLMEVFPQKSEIKLYPDLKRETKHASVRWESTDLTIILKAIGKSEFTLNIAGIDVNIPYSLTKDIWETEDNKIGIILSTSLVLSANRRNIFFDL